MIEHYEGIARQDLASRERPSFEGDCNTVFERYSGDSLIAYYFDEGRARVTVDATGNRFRPNGVMLRLQFALNLRGDHTLNEYREVECYGHPEWRGHLPSIIAEWQNRNQPGGLYANLREMRLADIPPYLREARP